MAALFGAKRRVTTRVEMVEPPARGQHPIGRILVVLGAYLAWSLIAKSMVEREADRALATMGLQDAPRFSVPTPFGLGVLQATYFVAQPTPTYLLVGRKRQSQSFFSEHPIPQAAKTLEQLLFQGNISRELGTDIQIGPTGQTLLPLSQDTALRLTTARYFTPSGRSIMLSTSVKTKTPVTKPK